MVSDTVLAMLNSNESEMRETVSYSCIRNARSLSLSPSDELCIVFHKEEILLFSQDTSEYMVLRKALEPYTSHEITFIFMVPYRGASADVAFSLLEIGRSVARINVEVTTRTNDERYRSTERAYSDTVEAGRQQELDRLDKTNISYSNFAKGYEPLNIDTDKQFWITLSEEDLTSFIKDGGKIEEASELIKSSSANKIALELPNPSTHSEEEISSLIYSLGALTPKLQPKVFSVWVDLDFCDEPTKRWLRTVSIASSRGEPLPKRF